MSRLENWIVITDLYTGVEQVYGQVYGDFRWKDGTDITTSVIKEITDTHVTTRNSTYELGAKLKVEVDEL